ncbi:hypothetical protein BVG19_g4764 [[Candida] boidinii]|nr:hypothetical protein BVG19_g4764 [[Candida] boidinii]OWB54111.1 hypothetical protein B5S27_g5750 [[Candida] boidinii]OWB70210.1 hypothetical protein B5S30_g5682 [[Candida] boidinii]OWB84478.1 hypothetical protein B5S33_g3125 [[Candida] boidinii]
MSFLEGVSINSFELEFHKFLSSGFYPKPNLNPNPIFITPTHENNTIRIKTDANSSNNSTSSSLIKRITQCKNEPIAVDRLPMNGSYSNGSNSPLGIRTPLSFEIHQMQISHLLPQLGIFRNSANNNANNNDNNDNNNNIYNVSANFNNFNIYNFSTPSSRMKTGVPKLQLENQQIGLPSPSNVTDGVDDDTISMENDILPTNLQNQNNVRQKKLQVLTPTRTLLVPDVMTTSTLLGLPNWKTVYQNPNTNHGSSTYSIFNSINTPIREIDKHFDELHVAIPTIYNSTPTSNERNKPFQKQMISDFETLVKAFEMKGYEPFTNVTNGEQKQDSYKENVSQNIEFKSNKSLNKEIHNNAIRKSNLRSKQSEDKKKKKVEFNICKDIFQRKVLIFENSVNKVLKENNAFFPITKNTLQSNKERNNQETGTIDNPEIAIVKRKRGRPRGKKSSLKLNKQLSTRNELYDFSKKMGIRNTERSRKRKTVRPRKRTTRKSTNLMEKVIDTPAESIQINSVEHDENQLVPAKRNKNLDENKIENKIKVNVEDKQIDEDYQYEDADLEQKDLHSSSRYSKLKVCRSKNGCWTCRLRRKRCPEQRPVCSECQRLGITCDGYDDDRPDYMISSNKAKIKMQEIKKITLSKRNRRLISRRGNKRRKRIKREEEDQGVNTEENRVDDNKEPI